MHVVVQNVKEAGIAFDDTVFYVITSYWVYSDLGTLLKCHYCPNSQHEECVPLSYPGSHPKVSVAKVNLHYIYLL